MQMNCAGTLFFVLPNPSINCMIDSEVTLFVIDDKQQMGELFMTITLHALSRARGLARLIVLLYTIARIIIRLRLKKTSAYLSCTLTSLHGTELLLQLLERNRL